MGYRFLLAILLFGFVFCSEDSYAQIQRRKVKRNNKHIRNFKGQKRGFAKSKRYNYIGFGINTSHYQGDLAPNNRIGSSSFKFTRPGASIWFGHRFGPVFTMRGSFMWTWLEADDFSIADPNDSDARFRYVRNLHFRNQIKELSVTAMVDLKPNQATYINRVQWTPYAFIGISVFHHQPQARVNEDSSLPEAGSWVNLKPLGTEGQNGGLVDTDVNFGAEPYSNIQLAVPVGVGFRYRITEVFDISGEFAFRWLFTDYIDDVSKNYVDLDVLDSDLAREMSYRSDEINAARSGEARDLDNPNIASIVNNRQIYDGRNGGTYDVVAGYGSEFRDNKRGGSTGDDSYTTFTIKLTYILGKTLHRPKFR